MAGRISWICSSEALKAAWMGGRSGRRPALPRRGSNRPGEFRQDRAGRTRRRARANRP